eukprot:70024-Rhodomonas_salina.1
MPNVSNKTAQSTPVPHHPYRQYQRSTKYTWYLTGPAFSTSAVQSRYRMSVPAQHKIHLYHTVPTVSTSAVQHNNRLSVPAQYKSDLG